MVRRQKLRVLGEMKKLRPVLEKTIKTAVKKRLNAIGAYHFWPVQMGLGEAALDCIGCYQGVFFSIETKAPGKKITARQKFTSEKIVKAQGLVYVIDSIEAANELFNDRIESNQANTSSVRRAG